MTVATQTLEVQRCNVPPEGWYCTRTAGHEGPCAAYSHEMTGWASPKLGRAYEAVSSLRADLAQPSESSIDETLRHAMDAIETADMALGSVAA